MVYNPLVAYPLLPATTGSFCEEVHSGYSQKEPKTEMVERKLRLHIPTWECRLWRDPLCCIGKRSKKPSASPHRKWVDPWTGWEVRKTVCHGFYHGEFSCPSLCYSPLGLPAAGMTEGKNLSAEHLVGSVGFTAESPPELPWLDLFRALSGLWLSQLNQEVPYILKISGLHSKCKVLGRRNYQLRNKQIRPKERSQS